MEGQENSLFTNKNRQNQKAGFLQSSETGTSVFSKSEKKINPDSNGAWKILVVDDDEDIHTITNLALRDFNYKNKNLRFLSSYSAESTKAILEDNKDIALILLDVVMESTNAGLDLAKYIREVIENKNIQIVLRTGQAGYAPEREVIRNYEINDYKTKTELTNNKLFTMVFSALRAYEALIELDSYSKDLEIKVNERTIEIQQKNKELEKLSVIASKTDNAVIIVQPSGEIQWANDGFSRIYEYSLEEFKTVMGSNLLGASYNPDFASKFVECLEEKKSVHYVATGKTKTGKELWVNTNLIPILNDDNTIKFLVAMDTDITKIKKAEEEIAFLYEIAISRKNEIQKQKSEIELQKADILDSINYAKIIQNSILPPYDKISCVFPESFILYYPKDVVSGDFYYYAQVGDIHVIAVVDCTGHGVPGAFMSMIGFDILNQIVYKEGIVSPATILSKLDNGIIFALGSDKNDLRDGMDLAICCIDKNKMEMQFAGANNNIFLMREGGKEKNVAIVDDPQINIFYNEKFTLFEIKGNSYGIGRDFRNKVFENHKFTIKENDSLYLFSDGFVDQFGGPSNKKYKINNFRNFLLEAQDLDMSSQKFGLENEFKRWKGNQNQIDDITIVGLKISSAVEDRMIHLSESDRVYLQQVLVDLDAETIYDISNIICILDKAISESKPIQKWKELIIQAIYAFDEDKYNELIAKAR